ncbi:MAG: hypothetical protein OH354_01420, partial [Candidatus Parvarchaeota archaeon]|nr:hypothetical protein [Candidatus Jingweiarchaeum tengchongense]
YFKFNASDAHNTTDRAGIDFTLDKDDVVIEYVLGNNSQVNRSESTLLGVRINDTDNKSYVFSGVNVSFWVTFDQSNFDNGGINTTNSDGYVNYGFIPNCSYSVGQQYWKAGTVNNSCYKNVNSTQNYTLTIKGWLNNILIEPNGNTEPGGDNVYQQYSNVTFEANVTDECGIKISNGNVSFNVSRIGYETFACYANNYTDGYYNCTWNSTDLAGGLYDVKMFSYTENYNSNLTTYTNAMFIEVPPNLFGLNVSPSSVPWGVNINFYCNVSDRDDVVNVSLWVKKISDTSFTLKDSQNVTNPINTRVTFTESFSSSQIGEYEWKINVTDKYGQTNESFGGYFNITKRNVYFEYIAGNNTNVSRIGSNVTLLSVKVIDAVEPGRGISGPTGKLYVTTDQSNYILDSTTSAVSNYLNFSFNPSCSYAVNLQYWKIGFESDYYFANNSSAYFVNILSVLNSNITQPNGEVIAVGESLIVNANVSDDCGSVSGATIKQFNVMQDGSSYHTCNANDLGNGNYTCTFDTTGDPLGWYNVSFNVSKNFYNGTFIEKINAFQLRARSQLSGAGAHPSSEGWGYNFTLNVSVQDSDPDDVVNVSLWKAYNQNGPWIYLESKNCTNCLSENTLNFYPVFTCNDLQSGPIVYFKFNSSDNYNLTKTSSIFNITFQKDNVSFIVEQGSGITINREGINYGTFIVLINDTDKGIPVPQGLNGYFNFSYNTTPVWDSDHTNTTDENGRISYYGFDPNCSYSTGMQYWKLTINGGNCYETKEMTSWESYYLYGQLKNNLEKPDSLVYNVSDQIPIRFNVSTDCSDEGLINDVSSITIKLIHNQTGNEYSCTNINNEGNGWYNCTWNSTNKPEGNYSVRIETSRNYYNNNITIYWNRFWLENINPYYSNLIVTPSEGGFGDVYRYNVTIDDPENDTVVCKLYVNTTGEWIYKGSSTVTNGKGNCSITVNDFTCNDYLLQAENSFIFELNDSTNVINTTIASGPILHKDIVNVTYIAGNNTNVNRYGASQQLKLRIYDLNRSQPAINPNGTIWITNDSQNYNFAYVINGDSNGYLTLDFDPNCSYSVGKQYWKGGVTNDACYVEVNSTENYTVNVIGSLFNTVIQPDGEKFLRGDNVTIRANVTDDCNVIIDPVTVNFTTKSLKTNELFICEPVLSEGDGHYNCTFNTSSMPPKAYNLTMKTNKTNYNENITTLTYTTYGSNSFWIETKPELYYPNVTPQIGGWGETFILSVNVSDPDEDTDVVYFYKKQLTDANGNPVSDDWHLIGTSSGSSSTNRTATRTTTFNYQQQGNWSIMFFVNESVYESDVDLGNDTKILNITVEKNDVSIEYIAGNETTFNRVSENTTFILRVIDLDLGQSASGAKTSFWVTTNASDPNSWGPRIPGSDSNSTGHFYLYFPVGVNKCVYNVGKQKWKGGVYNDQKWKDANSSIFNVTITSEFTPKINQPIGPKNNPAFERGVDNIPLSGNLSDDANCGLVPGATVYFSVPSENAFYLATDTGYGNYTATILGGDTWNWNWGWHNLTMNGSKSYYADENSTYENAFYINHRPEFVEGSWSITPGSGEWGTTFTFEIKVKNFDGDNVTVYLWIRKSGGEWQLANQTTYYGPTPSEGATIKLNWTSNCDNVGQNEYKFNASDSWNFTTETPAPYDIFTIDKRTATIEYIAGDNVNVTREGTF